MGEQVAAPQAKPKESGRPRQQVQDESRSHRFLLPAKSVKITQKSSRAHSETVRQVLDRLASRGELTGGSLHHDAECLGLGGNTGPVEVGCTASAQNEPFAVHHQPCGCAHSIGMSPIGYGKPSGRNSFVHGKGQHLCKVRFDKGRRLVDQVVKKPVGTLVAKTAIDNFSPKISQTLTVTLAFGRQAAPNASQTPAAHPLPPPQKAPSFNACLPSSQMCARSF